MSPNLLSSLRLIRSENVGPVTFRNLLSYYGSAEEALDALPELAKRGGKKRPIIIQPTGEAEKEIAAAKAFGARMIVIGEGDYPKELALVADAPPVLTLLGHPLWVKKPCLGMVGSRNASANGCSFARRLAEELGNSRFTIVSGLARGIDTAAHLGSLASGTVAVVAGGIDHIYPPENADLHARVAEVGAIVSEAPFGSAPQARHFPARNRIIAGMSLGVIVMEANVKSGSLITASMALDYGREVFAVPGSPIDPRSAGCNKLIKQGATLLESAADVLANIPQMQHLKEEKPIDFSAPPRTLPSDTELETARHIAKEKLSYEPCSLDEWVEQCHISPHLIHLVLLELELAGRLVRHGAGRISLRIEDE